MIRLDHARIVTGAAVREGSLGIEGERIAGIWTEGNLPDAEQVIDLQGRTVFAGGIDAHVHFREPGLTRKADFASESRAALLGGVTAVLDMPNTLPPTTSAELLHEKKALAAAKSHVHYGFHIGATNDNLEAILPCVRSGEAAGIKVFMGSSTGGMLVDREETLRRIFAVKDVEILIHSEDEGIIRANLEAAKEKYGTDIPFSAHPQIRSRQACLRSTAKALEMAVQLGTRLHVLHITTAEEIEMIREAKRSNPAILAETSANYLWFCDEDYDRLGGRIKCNPAIKTKEDRAALRRALADGDIDTLGSDHAPHLAEEKERPYLECPSGVPSIQQSLPVLLTLARQEGIPLSRIARVFSEVPAEVFGIAERGRIEVGCKADLVIVDPDAPARTDNAGKCGWSPYEGEDLRGAIEMVFLDGKAVVENGRLLPDLPLGKPLTFKRA